MPPLVGENAELIPYGTAFICSNMTDIKFVNQAVSACIATLGVRKFYDAFFKLLESAFKIDQCVIFQLDRNNELSCLICRNFRNERSIKTTAKSYVEGGFQSDPNLSIFREIKPGEVRLVYFDDLVSKMDPAYREHYFDDMGLSDKVSIITATTEYRYYINLYRAKDSQAFYQDKVFSQDGLDSTLAAMIVKHYELNQSLREEGSLAFLTERERDVCNRILQAKKSEQIADELEITVNTVVTYRKRAYAKLGINSRRALFALCERK